MMRIVLILLFTCACVFTHAQVNNITTIAGTGVNGYSGDGGLAINAKFDSPYAMTLDKDKNLLVCDGFNHVIRKILFHTGFIVTIAGNGSGGFSGDGGYATNAQLYVPDGIAIDDENNVYISDALNARIRKIDAITGIISTVAGNGVSGSGGDGGIAINGQINQAAGIYVHDIYIYIYRTIATIR